MLYTTMNTSSLLILSTWLLGLIACFNHSASHSEKTLAGHSPVTSDTSNTQTVSKDELTKIYAQAIALYIRSVHADYPITFNTLYFGKHVYGQPDDFPDIQLPETIAHIPIRLVTPEAGSQKQKEHKSSWYINLIGWVDAQKADFTFVTFSNGFEHQFDFFAVYTYNAQSKAFELATSRFENFGFRKGK